MVGMIRSIRACIFARDLCCVDLGFPSSTSAIGQSALVANSFYPFNEISDERIFEVHFLSLY